MPKVSRHAGRGRPGAQGLVSSLASSQWTYSRALTVQPQTMTYAGISDPGLTCGEEGYGVVGGRVIGT